MRKQIQIEKKIQETHYEITCDICGKDSRDYDAIDMYLSTDDELIWSNDDDSSEAEISCKLGNHFLEGDFRNEYTIDVCPRCFMEKVKPLLEKELNVKFSKSPME